MTYSGAYCSCFTVVVSAEEKMELRVFYGYAVQDMLQWVRVSVSGGVDGIQGEGWVREYRLLSEFSSMMACEKKLSQCSAGSGPDAAAPPAWW